MKALLKLLLPTLLMPCIAWSAPKKVIPENQKSTRIVFTEEQVPQFVAIERKGKIYVVIDSNRLQTSIETKNNSSF
jgi:hypothetical protein